MSDVDDMVSAMQTMVESTLSTINTSMPGVVVSYDAARNRAVVRPTVAKRLADGRELPAPNVVEVPMVWQSAGGATMTMPVAPGDGVLLHFSQRSMEGWLGGSEGAPDDPRQFDMSDAIATPGLMAARSGPVDPTNMVISFGGVSLTLTPAGELLISAPGGVKIVSPLVENTGEVKAGTIGLKTHRHTGVTAGGGISTGPIA